jgi:hypothetical protein
LAPLSHTLLYIVFTHYFIFFLIFIFSTKKKTINISSAAFFESKSLYMELYCIIPATKLFKSANNMSPSKPLSSKSSKKKASVEVNADEELSEYEKIRLAHIKRNHEFMEQLGLFSVFTPLENDTRESTRKAKPKLPPMPEELRRRSPRIKNEQPQYTNEIIDTFGEDLDASSEKAFKKRKIDTEESDVDYESLKNEMREAAMLHMEQVRQAMLPTAISDEASARPDEWRDEAIRRWGPAAGAGEKSSWKEYVQSRLSTPPPVSPLDMLQEYYCADSWRLLVTTPI